MDERTEYVKQWIWIDYDLPGWSRYQVLVKDETAQIISNCIAVALTLTLPRLLKFIHLLFPKKATHRRPEHIRNETSHGTVIALNRLHEEGSSDEDEENVTEEDEPDLPLSTTLHAPRPVFLSSRIASGILKTVREAESFESAAIQIGSRHLGMGRIALPERTQGKRHHLAKLSNVAKNFKEDKLSFALVSALMLMLFGLFIGEQIVAVTVARVFSGSTGLSQSPRCGNWEYYGDNLTAPQIYLDMATVDMATQRAISYIDSCYGNEVVTEGCDLYYNRTISYSEEHNASCPFPGDVCLYGQTSAYALDSGFMDSNVLGINDAKRYQFRRMTTCSPIITNSSYIDIMILANGTNLHPVVAYLYSANASGVPYFTQPVDYQFGYRDYVTNAGYYQSRTYATSLHGVLQESFTLRPEFMPPESDVSLIFIRPRFLVYSEPSDDPIFPADVLNGDNRTYINSLSHATVLGCVDTAEIRDPDTGQIWVPRNFTSWRTTSTEWRAAPMKNHFLLLGLALEYSNTWTVTRIPISLDAQRKIWGLTGISMPLAREQWKVEARRIFDISLAMLQGRIYDIARGRDAVKPGARNAFDKVNQPICSMVKIATTGWTNVSLLWLVILPTSAFLLWFASINIGGRMIIVWFHLDILRPCFSWLYYEILTPVSNKIWNSLLWLVRKI